MPFISFEGIDGSGKSTQARILATWLAAHHDHVILTKEPDGGRLGLGVRAILVEPRATGMLSSIEELLLISAARYDHVQSVIAPALAKGAWVICDRYIDSTFAFQMFETDLNLELFDVITRAVVGDTIPDLTFVLDIDPSIGLQRRHYSARADTIDPSEYHRDFNRIRRGLLAVTHQHPGRCRLVDASADESSVAAAIQAMLKDADF